MKKTGIALVALLQVFACSRHSLALPYICLYPDESRTNMTVNTTSDYELIELWVWVRPDDLGGICAEYKLDLPENILPVSVTLNPLHNVVQGQATESPGISICFAECQYDWFWTARVQALVLDSTPRFLAPEPHDFTQAISIATCESGYPVVDMSVLSWLGVNTCRAPTIIGVEVAGPSTIRAIFDRTVLKGQVDNYYFNLGPSNFWVYEKDNPSMDIAVVSAEKVEGQNNAIDLVIAGSVDSDKHYIIAAYNICYLGFCGPITPQPKCGDSSMEIAGIISVEELSWGAIKNLYN